MKNSLAKMRRTKISPQQVSAALIPLLLLLSFFSGGCVPGEKSPEASEGKKAVPAVSKPAIKKGEIEPSVSAIGYLEPGEGVIRVAAPRYLGPSIVRDLFVSEGDKVEKGQVLAFLDSHDRLHAAVGEADKALETAREKRLYSERLMSKGEILAQEAKIRKLRAELEFLEADSKRSDSLARIKAVPEAERESIQSRWKAKSEEMSEAVNLRDFLKEKWLNDFRMAGIEIGLAESTLKRASAELELTTIRAPFTGRVLQINTREGEAVLDRGVLDLGETDRMYAVAEVYQSDIQKVRVGARARVRGDGMGLEVSGKVERIGLVVQKNEMVNPDLAADIDSRVVRVRIRLDSPEIVAGLSNLRVICVIEK